MSEPRGDRAATRFVKRLVRRIARAFNRAQIADIEATIRSVAELAGLTAELSAANALERRQAYADREESIAALRSDLVAVQQQLAERDVGRDLGGGPTEETPGPAAVVAGPDETTDPAAVAGINLFGDWEATTGIAQAARRLALALHDRGLDLAMTTVHSGAPRDTLRVPEALRDLPSGRPYHVDLWTANVNEFPLIGDDLLRPSGRPTYAIGVWYWELPTFPRLYVEQMKRVDEIWVATRFVRASFRRATDRPVHVVPAIVPDPKPSDREHRDFGLYPDELVFLFSFDVNSTIARKNPGGVIEAFARAFPTGRPGVRLVIKVLNLDLHPDVATWLRPAIAAVDGILIEDDLTHAELVDLFACADVYVSLHRSEGFGLGIAEAMSLGKPVVATAYSGNLDFTDATNSCLVSYRIRPISADDHRHNPGVAAVYEEGAMWAEPDLDQAARWMQLLAADPGLRRRLGEAARLTIQGRYSTKAATDAVVRRLAEIGRLRRLV